MANRKKDLVQIIRDNPGCVAEIDNDCWTLYKLDPGGPLGVTEDMSDDAIEKWEKRNTLADSNDDFKPMGGYESNCYGGDILAAMAVILGVTVRGV